MSKRKPRQNRMYYDNLIRFRMERIMVLFGKHPEQRLTDLAAEMGIDRANVHLFMQRLVQRKFIYHDKGGKYVFRCKHDDGYVCIEMDWLYTEPKVLFLGFKDEQLWGWWTETNDSEAMPTADFGDYISWAAKSIVPALPVEVVSWPKRLGLVIRRVIRLFSLVVRSKQSGERS